MATIIGIDLGTTSSRASVYTPDGKTFVIENPEGDGTTPSHIGITESGHILVGKAARRYAINSPENVVFSIKRLLGRQYDDPAIARLKKFVPYQIIKSSNGEAWVKLRGKCYSPEELLSYMLKKIKIYAEQLLNEPINDAVISVPAYFNNAQIQSTKAAAQIAGFEVKRTTSEPTLAAQSYFLQLVQEEQLYLVYDLGGGTFDVSITECDIVEGERTIEVLATDGDTFLGGEDFDYAIVEYLAAKFRQVHEIDLMSAPISTLRLKEAAEKAKIELSTEFESTIDLPFIAQKHGKPLHFKHVLSREEFEQLIKPTVKKTFQICKNALADADLKEVDIDKVVVIGGSTRIPVINKILEGFFNKQPFKGVRREDSVSLGAAITGGGD